MNEFYYLQAKTALVFAVVMSLLKRVTENLIKPEIELVFRIHKKGYFRGLCEFSCTIKKGCFFDPIKKGFVGTIKKG